MHGVLTDPGRWASAEPQRRSAREEVTPKLRAAGHHVHPLTLAGLADRASEAAPGVDIYTHVSDIVRVVKENDLRDVVLVGHSGGERSRHRRR